MVATIMCRAFEDNNSALLLSNSQHLTNRNKYLLVKLHHFWSHVKSGEIEIIKVDTSLQVADLLTKGLSREVFERLRHLIMGW
jgi:hypothetical protein